MEQKVNGLVLVGQKVACAIVVNSLFLYPLKQTSVWPNWYGVQDDLSVEEPAPTLPRVSSFSHLDMPPPPYEAVSAGNHLNWP